MNCQRVQELFIDHQEGTLQPDEAALLRSHLASCPTCQREWSALQEITRKLDDLPVEQASPRLREQFYAMLETHQREADAPSPFALAKSRIDRFFEAILPAQPALQFALAITLLVAGVFAGSRFLPTPAVVLPTDDTAKTELAALRAQVDGMGKLVTFSLLQQKSTSDRLQGVLATMELKNPDRKVLTDLVGALAFDPSLNVRLSAVEALALHANDEVVRAGLLAALPRESAPLVQMAMIELLASVRDVNAAPLFEQLSRDESADKNVRDAAKRALASLRTPTPAEAQPNALAKEPVPAKAA
ncbi:MAG: zf-HC2 domain-containing protein [Candidatus Didemnitutus sp.]|nr:zf-HC2 domain-containing protein [Candidatus Didemnitutus sp.]